jgi:hypothetical protein
MLGKHLALAGWGGIGRTENPTYTGNKRDGFTYDASGNVTNDLGQNFTYDATGQQAMASYSGYSLAQAYDHPGTIGAERNYFTKRNFYIKAYKGEMHCEVAFHLTFGVVNGQITNPGWGLGTY